ncbi:MAG: hypothetical protein WC464_00260 [Bdellovibrionales bacterium]|jgi:hypothetical protein
MDKDQFTKAMMLYNTGAINLPEFTEFCMTYIKELEQQVEVLSFKIEDNKKVA